MFVKLLQVALNIKELKHINKDKLVNLKPRRKHTLHGKRKKKKIFITSLLASGAELYCAELRI